MKNQKKEWRNIGKYWAVTGALERHKPKILSDEMKAFCIGLIKGLIIGFIAGILVTCAYLELGG